MGVLLGEAANGRIVVSGAEVVGLRLAVKVLAAVAERVLIQRVRILLYAECIVIIGPCARSGAVRQPGVFRAGGYDLLLLSAAYLGLAPQPHKKSGSHKRKAIITPLQPAEKEAQKRPQSPGQVHQDQSHPNDAEGRLLQMCGNAA